MTRRLAEVAARAGVSEATVSRVLNSKPGVSEATRSSGADRARRAGLRAADQAARRASPAGRAWCCPSCRTRSSRRSPRSSAATWPSTGSHRCCAPRQPGHGRGRLRRCCSSSSRSPGSCSPAALYSQADADHAHYERLVEPQAAGGAGQRRHRRARRSRGRRVTTRVAMEQALDHLLSLGHERIGLLLGPRDHVPSMRKLDAAVVLLESPRPTPGPDAGGAQPVLAAVRPGLRPRR